MTSESKKAEVESDLLTDINMLLMVEKGIRGGMCNSICRYAKANNKYMKSYDKNKESKHLILNGLKLLLSLMKISLKNYDEKSEEEYFLEVDVQYPEKLCELQSDLPFLPGRKKLKNAKKLVVNLQDKGKYVVYIKILKQALNNGLILKKVHRAISFN